MDTNESQFKVSKVTPAYWRLTFNNPPINMLDPQTILELQDLVSEFEADPQLKVVVFDSADPISSWRISMRRAPPRRRQLPPRPGIRPG